MNSKLSISDISGIVSKKNGLTKKECEAILKEMFQYASEIISSGESLTINGIGTFGIIWVEQRGSVDINTGEPIVIPGHYKLTFTPDPSLRDAVNEPFACFTTEILPPKSEQAAKTVETALREVELQNTESEDAAGEEPTEVAAVSVAAGTDSEKKGKEEVVGGDMLQEEPAIEMPAAESAEAAVEEKLFPESGKEKDENQEADVENVEYAISQQAEEEAEEAETTLTEIEKIETEIAPTEDDEEAPSTEVKAEAEIEAEAAQAETAGTAAFAEDVSAQETIQEEDENLTPTVGDVDSGQKTAATAERTEQQIFGHGEGAAADEQTEKAETHSSPGKKEMEKEYRRRTRNGYIAGFITALLLCLVAGGTAYYIRSHSNNFSISLSIFKFPFNGGEEKTEMNKRDTAIVLQETVVPEQPVYTTPEASVDTTSVIETIEPGKFLTTIAKKHYGNKIFWVYIYRENEDRIWNPRYLPKGFKVIVPPPSKYAIDSEDEESIRRAQDLEKQILYEIE